jgi:hypothetical protein
MWDAADREEDARRLARGEMVLEAGHETAVSTVLDAEWDEIQEMPSESWSPISVALAVSLVFTMLLTRHYVTAAVFAGAALVAVGAWHWKEPQEA